MRAQSLSLFRQPWFLLCISLAVLHFILQKSGILIPFAHAYLDDLLCLPVVCGLALTAMRLIKGNPWYRLEFRHVLITFLLFSFWFEYYLPLQSEVYTADPLDLIAYALGGLFFWKFINPPAF